MSTITIGVDLAKSVFSVCVVDAAGHVQRRQDLGREAFALWLAHAEPYDADTWLQHPMVQRPAGKSTA
jgi:hypothetical protein